MPKPNQKLLYMTFKKYCKSIQKALQEYYNNWTQLILSGQNGALMWAE